MINLDSYGTRSLLAPIYDPSIKEGIETRQTMPQFVTSLDNSRWIVEYDLNRIPGHQKYEYSEHCAGDE